MKKVIFSSFLVAFVLGYMPTDALTQSQQALDVCRNVNPPVAWADCIQRYDQRQWELQQDPRWQEYQRQLRLQQQYQEQQLQLQRQYQEQQLQLQRRQLEQQRQNSNEDNNRGLSFMCKEAIGRGDKGGIFVFCN